MKKLLEMILAITVIGISFALGFELRRTLVPDNVRISITAMTEIYMTCSGNISGLSATNFFVYASCRDGRPVTVQNYVYK